MHGIDFWHNSYIMSIIQHKLDEIGKQHSMFGGP